MATEWWLGEPASGSDTFIKGSGYKLGQIISKNGISYTLVVGPAASQTLLLNQVINNAFVSQSTGWNILASANQAAQKAIQVAASVASSPLDAAAQDMAAGLEHGFIQIVNDLWTVVYPALQIIAGVLLILIAFVIIAKNGILSVAPLVAAMAA